MIVVVVCADQCVGSVCVRVQHDADEQVSRTIVTMLHKMCQSLVMEAVLLSDSRAITAVNSRAIAQYFVGACAATDRANTQRSGPVTLAAAHSDRNILLNVK